MRGAIILGLIGLLAGSAAATSIVNSPHNLSASGPGDIRAAGEQELCIFCHTPHGAAGAKALWNRQLSAAAYKVYSSSTLQAKPGQPTGSSKLCLSCHDGTIAVGSVLSRGEPVMMAGGITAIPPGAKGHLGTDLSDDHPISFVYDSGLVAKNPKLKDPATLDKVFRMSRSKEMQCHTCHNPHDDTNKGFLVMDNSTSQLCNACHKMGNTDVVGHAQCISCHKMHTAPSGPYLLKAAKVGDTCLTCHSGQVAGAANVAADFLKVSVHDTHSTADVPNPIPNTTSCGSCHEPHTITKGAGLAMAPGISGRMGQVPGVDANGAAKPAATYEYEVCFKCHADQAATLTPRVTRVAVQTNMRLKMNTTAVSFHPVVAAGANPDVPSLRPGWTTGSIIYCNDCHNTDTGTKATGAGPNGVHGSANRSLLVAGYTTGNTASESAVTYALCYTCHDRNSILADQSFSLHKRHVVDLQTPCSVCHDAHGISFAQGSPMKNFALINFDSAVVTKDTFTGLLEYSHTAKFTGSCTLTCHGVAHSGFPYAPPGVAAARMAPGLRRKLPAPAPVPVPKPKR